MYSILKLSCVGACYLLKVAGLQQDGMMGGYFRVLWLAINIIVALSREHEGSRSTLMNGHSIIEPG